MQVEDRITMFFYREHWLWCQYSTLTVYCDSLSLSLSLPLSWVLLNIWQLVSIRELSGRGMTVTQSPSEPLPLPWGTSDDTTTNMNEHKAGPQWSPDKVKSPKSPQRHNTSFICFILHTLFTLTSVYMAISLLSTQYMYIQYKNPASYCNTPLLY